MVDELRKLLKGWKYPIYYIPTQSSELDSKIVNVLAEEGIPINLIHKLDINKVELLDFLAYVDSYKHPSELIISVVSNVIPSNSGKLTAYRDVPIRTLPFTKEKWYKNLGIS